MLVVKSSDEARYIIENEFPGTLPEYETVTSSEALGRICALDIISGEDIPGYERSTVDGFALRASDTFGCSESIPAQLIYKGEILMGDNSPLEISAGECAYVPTGGRIPSGADAMVMVEYTEDLHDGFIYINKASAPGQHLIFKGDDLKEGDVIVKKGTVIRPLEIGALSSAGISSVPVVRRPKVAVISTGDELIDIGSVPEGSQIRDVNSSLLASAVSDSGGEPVIYGIVPDDYSKLRQTVEKALDSCDILFLSGGSSVGTRDITLKVMESIPGSEILFHGIAVKPGKPTILAKCMGKAVFGLPGHPVSAYFIAREFALPLVRRLSGKKDDTRIIYARTARNLPSNHGREEFVPVKLLPDGQFPAAVPVDGKSSLITTLSEADGYIRIGRDCEGLNRDDKVSVILL